jgi:hypothetical protein
VRQIADYERLSADQVRSSAKNRLTITAALTIGFATGRL